MRTSVLASTASMFGGLVVAFAAQVGNGAPLALDPASQEQAEAEKKVLADGSKHTLVPAIAEFRRTAENVEYKSGDFNLPGFLYRPAGNGPFPAVLWNHGSEKNPTGQPELARFYTEHGFVFFLPIREGHGRAPGEYIVDLQQTIYKTDKSKDDANRKVVALHERFNADVVAAVAWLKQQPYVDADKIVMSGCSYGGIQTLLSAEKDLGVRAYVPFAPGAMSWANEALGQRLEKAAANAKAPVYLLQAKNDFSTRPSERLGPLIKKLGAPSGNKLYEAFGLSHEQGHAAFACWSLGTEQWGGDVLEFIDAATRAHSAAR